MNYSIADILIHIDQTLTSTEREVLENLVSTDTCITSAHFANLPRKDSHLMLIAYDVECTTGSQIIQDVRNHGVAAQLIGL